MTTHIQVSREVFDEMKNCGDWDATLKVLSDAGWYADIWDEEVNSDKSFQDKTQVVVVGARRCNKTIITWA